MENASKALIIAGSILVSIVIITLGVMIVSGVTKTIQDGSNLTEQEIATYNQPFENYLGTQSGTKVRALCDLVRNHNAAHPDDESTHIKLMESDASSIVEAPTTPVTPAEVNEIKQKIKNGKTYTITLGYDKNSSLIVAIGIEDKK